MTLIDFQSRSPDKRTKNMKFIRTSLIALVTLTAVETSRGQQGASDVGIGADPATAAGWKLKWSDEFEHEGRPNPDNWGFEEGFVRNQELQWYLPDNARCENGLLVIEGRRERRHNPNYKPGSSDWKMNRDIAEYTSASLTTKGRHDWLYGRFEMRGRIDTRLGLWPAFWTMGVQGEWPSCGEIDILEYYRGDLLANVGWGTDRRWVPQWDSVRIPLSDFNDPDWSQKFHIWRMDWDEQVIELFVDGLLLNRTVLHEIPHIAAQGGKPFHQPHFIMLSVAIGGTNGGDPSGTGFPARFEVDYVRVYQK